MDRNPCKSKADGVAVPASTRAGDRSQGHPLPPRLYPWRLAVALGEQHTKAGQTRELGQLSSPAPEAENSHWSL